MPVRPCVCDAKLERCDATCNAKMLEKTFYMACLDLGDGVTALEMAERATDADASCEVGYVAGMRAAGLMGRRDLVARLYQQCERSLRSELGVAPMPATSALRDELLATVRHLVGAGVGFGTMLDADERDLTAVRWPSSRFR